MPSSWLITGSSRGLGLALARVVLEGGDSLVAIARQPEKLAELVESYGDRVRAVGLDVTGEAEAQHAVHTAVGSFGRLDLVVNNAGYANSAPVEVTSMEEFRTQTETDLFVVINVTKAALPILRRRVASIGAVASRRASGHPEGDAPMVNRHQGRDRVADRSSRALSSAY
jgi:NAD(P)-dependent dehydrogenase (short-subunit alcohol dehydrogenase family)